MRYCGRAGGGDVTDSSKRSNAQQWCVEAAQRFKDARWWIPGRRLLFSVWELCARQQKTTQKWVPREWIANQLAVFENDWGRDEDRFGHAAESFRWSILGQADIRIGMLAYPKPSKISESNALNPELVGYSRQWLYAFGATEKEIKTIEEVTDQFAGLAAGRPWRKPERFAEHVLCRLCDRNDKRVQSESLLTRYLKHDASPFGEFPICREYLGSLLKAAKGAEGSAGRGVSYEDLACYLFLLFGGCVPRRDVQDEDGVSQHDLVVSNYASSEGAFSSRFGRQFLVECKNLKRPADSAAVGYFLQRLHLAHCTFGVMFSKKGVTGSSPDQKHAKGLIRRAFHEHGTLCLVIAIEDIEELVKETYPTVSHMLFHLANKFQFGI
jgi:hypothetical protein